jgi:hypothetical protein
MFGPGFFEYFRDLSPLFSNRFYTLEKFNILINSPWGMLFSGVQMIQPFLAALLGRFVVFGS